MRSFDLVPFAVEHLNRFEPGPWDRQALEEPFLSTLRSYWPGRAISAVCRPRTLGIAGVSLRDGCAYPWMILSEEMRRCHPIGLTRLAKRLFAVIAVLDEVSRMEVEVERDFAGARRWIECLGFGEHESTFDIVRYVRT